MAQSVQQGMAIMYYKWDGANFDFLLDNTNSYDWLDFWYIDKGSMPKGQYPVKQQITYSSTGLLNNDDAAEIHFGQADGTGGYCSVWVQYADGCIVGHYIKY